MRRIAFASLLVLVSACASAPPGSGTGSRHNRDVITREEILEARTPGGTVWDLVSHVRPQFLVSRGINSLRPEVPSAPVVYLDGSRFGDIQTLKNLAVESVQRIEFLSAGSATTRYGTDHPAGAILILTH